MLLPPEYHSTLSNIPEQHRYEYPASLILYPITQTRYSITNRKYKVIYYALGWRGGIYMRLQERCKTKKTVFLKFIFFFLWTRRRRPLFSSSTRGGVWGWGDHPRPHSWGGPALQAYEFVKLYSPVNWKCWYILRLKSFFKVKFHSIVLGCLLYRNRHNQCLR